MAVVPVTVPSVGESISEGILARWLKADGQQVSSGDPLFELETDKASSVVPAAASGVLSIKVAEGETVAIGAAVGAIDPAGSARAPAAAKTADGNSTPAAAKNVEPPAQASTPAGTPGLSPAVRRIVAENAVDPAQVEPSGPGGRITKGDVIAHLSAPATAAPTPAAAPAKPAPPKPVPGGSESRERMSGLRQRIAERLVDAQHTAAILSTFNEVDMSHVMDLRARYKEAFQAKHKVGLGFMSFFVKAVVEALKAFPSVNARIEGKEIVHHHYYNIGVAVSTERGLMVPVVRDADQLSFAGIEKTIAGFAAKARDGTIGVDDLQGGTFTITNGGVFGSLLSTPILNPPQSGILGMHSIKKRPVVVDDQIVARPMMYLALSYDHRLVDGREAVSFLVRVKDLIESPERILFDV